MIRLTQTLALKITNDWSAQFPALQRYKPMLLARRVGPLVQGICLDRSSGGTSYRPTTFLHCLCTASSFISLAMGQRLLSKRHQVEESISVQFHDNHVIDAPQRLREACLLPLEGDLTLSEVLDAYHRYRSTTNIDSQYPIFLFRDAVLLASYLDKRELAIDLLDNYHQEMRTWPAHILSRWGGVDSWRNAVAHAANDRSAIVGTVEREIDRHKLTHLPAAALLLHRTH